MAKYDPDRIAETAEPYAPGTTGIEPLCDEFGRLVAAPVVGGGGGDATAANQVLGLTALDSIYDALQLVGTEATSADILAAVTSLSAGATLADLAAALAPLATEATQQDVLAALEAQAIDVGLIQTNVALLVPDLDSVRVATEATATATGTTADADTSSTLVGLLKWIKARLPTTLGSQGALKVEGVASGTPQPTSNAVGSQEDGHSATIGATSDADTSNTLIGRIKKILATLTDGTAKTVARGGAKGSTTAADVTSTASGSNHNSLDVIAYDASGNALFGTAAQFTTGGAARPTAGFVNAIVGGLYPNALGGADTLYPLPVTSTGLIVEGRATEGSTVGSERPVKVGGTDGTHIRTIRMKAVNPIAADYGLETREIPLQKSVVKTTAGTPAASLVVRAGPCWLFDVFVSNQTGTACYLTVYDATSAPSHGASAAARKIVGRHIDTKSGADPFNFFEDFDGMYFSTGCVLVVEMSEDAALVDTSGAPTLAMNATFVAGT